ncbi:MAG: SDR family oxidoreductase [Planctomycetota bacterium]
MTSSTSVSESGRLAGRRALVTGASRGIGREIALRLAAEGADVAINFLTSRDQAIDVAREIDALGRQAIPVKADVSRQDNVQEMVRQIRQHWGGLDIVVSNAAAGGFRALRDVSPINFEAVLRTNSLPVVWLAQAAGDLLADAPAHGKSAHGKSAHGKLVAISSHGSQWAVPNYGAIGASKAALESLVRHLALEWGPRGINFNCVLPGIIATDAIRSMPDVDQVLASAAQRVMVKEKQMQPADVAGAVAFLCSSDADWIQGHCLVVDGGASIRV